MAALGSIPGVSSLPISSKYRSQPNAPVTDAEREDLTRRLNDAFTAGAIDADDYQGFLDGLYAAKRLGELVPLVERLPVRSTYDSPAIVASTSTVAPGELTEARSATDLSKIAIVVGGAGLLIVLILLALLVF